MAITLSDAYKRKPPHNAQHPPPTLQTASQIYSWHPRLSVSLSTLSFQVLDKIQGPYYCNHEVILSLLTESSHMVVNVDELMRPVPLPPVNSEVENIRSESTVVANDKAIDISDEEEEENEPLIASAECRICQDECPIKNLESPCACSGSLKFALVLQSGQPTTVHFTVAQVPPSPSMATATTSTQQQHEDPV